MSIFLSSLFPRSPDLYLRGYRFRHLRSSKEFHIPDSPFKREHGVDFEHHGGGVLHE